MTAEEPCPFCRGTYRGLMRSLAKLEASMPTNHVAATMAPGTVLRFKYTNYQMETEWRRARVGGMPWFGSSEFHAGSQWFLPAFCLDRKATRQFAMRDMAEVSVEFVKESKEQP